MNEQRPSPMFPKSMPPARRGVYRVMIESREFLKPTGFSFWDGKRWHSMQGSVEMAYRARHRRATERVTYWHGLSREPQQTSVQMLEMAIACLEMALLAHRRAKPYRDWPMPGR